jgi:hypothetical protein
VIDRRGRRAPGRTATASDASLFRTGTLSSFTQTNGVGVLLSSLDEHSPATCAGTHVHAKDLYSQHGTPACMPAVLCWNNHLPVPGMLFTIYNIYMRETM